MIYFVSIGGDDTSAGDFEHPWKTLETAVGKVNAGDILYIRAGEYILREAVMFQKSGTEARPIVYSAYPGEDVIIDARDVYFHNDTKKYPLKHETGALFLYNIEHVQIRNIKLINSHGHGIAVRDSSYIVIDGCTTENTYCCGISLWDTKSTGEACSHCKIIGNTVVKATTWDMLPAGEKRGHEPPHEAISVAGAAYFEVFGNHVHHCDKEGIDVKEVSHHGTVHHNHVHHVDRQGLYADAWFGPLTNVDFYENTVHDCHGAGIVISVEEGHGVSDIRVFNNTVYDNHGSGFLFGTWGRNGPRKNIDIFGNTFAHNGYGKGEEGYFWITGGICLLSTEVYDTKIYNNIVSGNCGFQIGYSAKYIDNCDIEAAMRDKNIRIFENITSESEKTDYPIHTGWENSTLYQYDSPLDAKEPSAVISLSNLLK